MLALSLVTNWYKYKIKCGVIYLLGYWPDMSIYSSGYRDLQCTYIECYNYSTTLLGHGFCSLGIVVVNQLQ